MQDALEAMLAAAGYATTRPRPSRGRPASAGTTSTTGASGTTSGIWRRRALPASLFAERTGYPLALVARELAAATARGLLDPDPTQLRPTALGRRFLNDLQQIFLPG
jgi:hypothetical protein